CFAEVASRFREAGGPYLYVREAFGPQLGFQAGWLTFWIRVLALAANLNVFVEYLGQLAPWAAASPGRVVVIVTVMAILTAINLIGVRQATWTVDLFTLAKLLPLVLLVLLGLPRLDPEALASQAVARPEWTQAILLLMFAYGGFEAPLIPAGEARDPRRDTAFALLVALGVIALLYGLVQLAIVGVVPRAADVKAPVAVAFGVLLGPAGVTLAALGALVSVWGYATGSVLQAPRLLFSLGERRELPALLAHVHPRHRTPDAAILAYAVVTTAIAAYGTFEGTATLSAIVRLVTYGLTCAALPMLRRRRPGEAPGFRAPAAALVAPAGALFCLWLLATRSFGEAWVLPVLMAFGWLLWRGSARGRAAASDAAPTV
ncbi:MAG TPA: APC family permease, partial [Vicinamibacteria bacterium]|nr:APC family permease [Vicinamibacteria bacterium]